jgi:adenosylcobinamide-phosphate synthase
VFYRMTEHLSRSWSRKGLVGGSQVSPQLQQAARQAWTVIDWLPARLTALSFAVVGSFEEAIEGWRFHAQRFPNDNDGVILAATSGEALKRREGISVTRDDGEEIDLDVDSEATPGREPEIGHLRSVVGLVWRSVVVWLLLLALLSLARLLG